VTGVQTCALPIWRPNEIRIDGRVLLFTAAATFASALLFGILPAWRASRTDAGDALKTRTSGSLSHGRLRAGLVVAEVALSVVLLTGAALLIRSFARLTHLNPGFEPRGLVSVTVEVPADRYPAPARRAFVERVREAIRRLPGVTAASAANGVPPTAGTIYFGKLEVEGRPQEAAETVLPSMGVEPSYFATLRIPILAGRGFTDADPPMAAIVGESLARRLAGGGSALGVRFRLHDGEWYTVVGVAGEVRQDRMMERETSFEMYLPLWPPASSAPPPNTPSAVRAVAGRARTFVSYTIAVRAAEGVSLTVPIKQAVWSVDASQPVGDVLPAEALLSRSLSQDRFAATLMGTFAALALLLAAAGLYAVLAHLVAQRRQEIGIRMALGAATGDVARIIVGRGVGMTAIGIAIGLAGAWMSARVLTLQLYGVAPHDPLSFAAVPVVLFGIALLASWLPARRALSVDPASALRAE